VVSLNLAHPVCTNYTYIEVIIDYDLEMICTWIRILSGNGREIMFVNGHLLVREHNTASR